MDVLRIVYLSLYWWFLLPTTGVAVSSECSDRCQGSQSNTEHDGFRIFYFVQVHNERTMNDAVNLLRAIRDPLNSILIHVDLKASELLSSQDNLLLREIEACPCQDTIRIKSRFDVEWGQWSMNLPTLWGMQIAVEETENWDVWINISGDSLPVYSASAMARVLSQLPYNFVTSSACETGLLPTNVYHFPSFWHKRRHYTHDGTEADPVIQYADEFGTEMSKRMTTHFGSQWVILQREFCTWLVSELGRDNSMASRFRHYLEFSGKLMTDETFIPTLIMHVDEFRKTLPKTDENGYLVWRNQTSSSIQHSRYERMDEHVPTAFGHLWENQRYAVPISASLDQPRPWGPYFLGVYDLKEIKESGALLVRKVSDRVDYNIVEMLPFDDTNDIPCIGWPNVVEVTPKIDWEAKISRARLEMGSENESDYDEINQDGFDL